MIDLPFGFHSGELFCYQSNADPTVFYYVPGGPVPDVAAGGLPTVRLLTSTTGELTLATAWLPPAGAVDALQRDIARLYPDLDPDLVEVQMAPPAHISVDAIELTLAANTASPQLLASSTTSRTPPYLAVLTASLDEAQISDTRHALEDGAEAVLLVTIRFALHVPVSATASISGDVQPMLIARLARLPDALTDDEALSLVDDAIAEGALKTEVALRPPGPLGSDLEREVLRTARDSAAKVIAGDVQQLVAQRNAQAAGSDNGGRHGDRHDTTQSAKKRWWAPARASAPPPEPPVVTPVVTPVVILPSASVQASASQSARVRVPADSTEQWLSATTDLGAWMAANRQSS